MKLDSIYTHSQKKEQILLCITCGIHNKIVFSLNMISHLENYSNRKQSV